MSAVHMNLLKCDGFHGTFVYSRSGADISRVLDGWCQVNSQFDTEGQEGFVMDLCPHCSIEMFISRLVALLFGLPSCGYEMEHGNDPDYGERRALFIWKIYPEGISAYDVDINMFEQNLAWHS